MRLVFTVIVFIAPKNISSVINALLLAILSLAIFKIIIKKGATMKPFNDLLLSWVAKVVSVVVVINVCYISSSPSLSLTRYWKNPYPIILYGNNRLVESRS